MDAPRTERLTVNLAPEVMEQLLRFAQRNRWTLSTAAAVLMERGLAEGEQQK